MAQLKVYSTERVPNPLCQSTVWSESYGAASIKVVPLFYIDIIITVLRIVNFDNLNREVTEE